MLSSCQDQVQLPWLTISLKAKPGRQCSACCGGTSERERCSGIYGKPVMVLEASISISHIPDSRVQEGLSMAHLINSPCSKVIF